MQFDLMELPLVIGTGFVAAFVSSIAGGGVTVIMLPVLVLRFGIRTAMPIVTISLFAASASRVVVNRREIALPVAGWFALGSLPSTLAGTYLFTVTAPGLLTRLLGVFLLATVALRRLHPAPPAGLRAAWFLPLGAVFGFLTGISAAVAAVVSPFFLRYGLRKGAYVGTVGLNIFMIQIAKLAVFESRNFLQPQVLAYGAVLVPFMVLGTVLGRRLLERVSEALFVVLIEGVMVLAGLNFVFRGAA